MRSAWVHTAAVALTSVVLVACSTSSTSSFAVDDVWARSTPNGLGAVYATFTTDQDDELVDVSVDAAVAAVAELHEVINDDGVMRMQQVAGIPVSASEARVLRPGDYHVMLLDLPRMLEEGETFTVTFTFASGRTLQAEAQVRTIEDDTMSQDHSMTDMDEDEAPMSGGNSQEMPRG
ncbi:MAG: copper chaperone PCu(A)C [Nitriliruptoraceae bacterium]